MATYELSKTSAGGAIPIFVDGTWTPFQAYKWTNGAWEPVTVCRHNGTTWEMLGSIPSAPEEETNISFTIGKTICETKQGTTWSEYINGAPAIETLTTYNDFITCDYGEEVALINSDGTFVQPTDTIIENGQYNMTYNYDLPNTSHSRIGHFILDGVFYHFNRNIRTGVRMTWSEWIKSTYNIDGYSIDNNSNYITIVLPNNDGSSNAYMVVCENGTHVYAYDTITEPRYILSSLGEGNEPL